MEKNKGVKESRTLETRPVFPEEIGFPFAAQIALLTRQRQGRKTETVGLITDLPPAALNPQEWLAANRQGWGIENGLHQRLDVTLNDDRCRVRTPKGLWIFGMVRRIAVSLFMHWLQKQPRPKGKSLTDFQTVMGEDNLTAALHFITDKHPKL